jgi:AAA domain
MSFDPEAATEKVLAGVVVPSTNGQDAPEQPLALSERIRHGLLSTSAVKELTPSPALVDGVLFMNSLAMLYGPSGIGKSFLAVDIALHVAHGNWWRGRPVTGGPVLYVAAEGAAGLGLRIKAWETHHRTHHETHPVEWLPWAVNIHDPAWAAALADVVAERKPVLVVLDTFARCAVGAEENSARDVGVIVAHLDAIRRAGGCCVLIVHHTGKDGGAGARGSTALKGAMDTEIELTGESARFTMRNTKQKDAAEASPMHLGLVAVEGTHSVVIDRAQPLDPDDLSAGVAATLDALVAVDVPEGVPASVWKGAVDAPERSFYRHRKGLIEQGLVANVGTDARPRYRPMSPAVSTS